MDAAAGGASGAHVARRRAISACAVVDTAHRNWYYADPCSNAGFDVLAASVDSAIELG